MRISVNFDNQLLDNDLESYTRWRPIQLTPGIFSPDKRGRSVNLIIYPI